MNLTEKGLDNVIWSYLKSGEQGKPTVLRRSNYKGFGIFNNVKCILEKFTEVIYGLL